MTHRPLKRNAGQQQAENRDAQPRQSQHQTQTPRSRGIQRGASLPFQRPLKVEPTPPFLGPKLNVRRQACHPFVWSAIGHLSYCKIKRAAGPFREFRPLVPSPPCINHVLADGEASLVSKMKPSPTTSIIRQVPGKCFPSSISPASGLRIRCWMTRLRGRAP